MKTVQIALDFADSRLSKSVKLLERNKPVLKWGSPPGGTHLVEISTRKRMPTLGIPGSRVIG